MAQSTCKLDYSFDDVFDPRYEAESLSALHTRNCTMKGDTTVDRLLQRIIEANPNVLRPNSHFVRRRKDKSCFCINFKYEISLQCTTLRCYGCSRVIKSTTHTCKYEDLFGKNAWLGKHQNPIYREIRMQNFKMLASKLPYRIPEKITDSCDSQSYSCQSVTFLDEF